jgi:hypothetical protein
MEDQKKLFSITDESAFLKEALELFRFHYENHPIYRFFSDGIGVDPSTVDKLERIPFLPIELFKTHDILCNGLTVRKIFLSSGTTGTERSRHLVADPELYHESLLNGFIHFYGSPSDYRFLALTPGPEQNPDSSLIHMIARLMEQSGGADHGFYLNDFPALDRELRRPVPEGKTNFLIGLTHAVLDFAEQFPGTYPGLIVAETGGMKGRRVEMIREDLHSRLCRAFGVSSIHSEYGMTELFSQAWSKGAGLFRPVPWMKILIRGITDPLSYREDGKTGGICVIDLANRDSCPFIATQDLGRRFPDGSFEVLGRFDASDARGCSLMIGE